MQLLFTKIEDCLSTEKGKSSGFRKFVASLRNIQVDMLKGSWTHLSRINRNGPAENA